MRRTFCYLIFLQALFAAGVRADGRFIVRIAGGLPLANTICTLLGCQVSQGLDGTLGQVFLITNSNSAIPDSTFLSSLLNTVGIVDVEPDLLATSQQSGYPVPAALSDKTPVTYFGQTLPDGYVHQPANTIIGLSTVQSAFQITGASVVVAIVDTGVDQNHPALRDLLVSGYDFTRNSDGGDETADVTLFSTPFATGQPVWLSGSQVSDVDQSTAAVVDGNPGFSDFGHGTMVAGIVHIVAPRAHLMPLKAFSANGTGYTSDILRAIYWAVAHNADVLNMSFSLPGYSLEVQNALKIANSHGIICVAAAGNQGQPVNSYPAAYSTVIGVASTTNSDSRSNFSNYGSDVRLAAPGEGIVTSYPFGFYAAGWGTSFSTPYVAGVAALMLDSGGSLLGSILAYQNQSTSAKSFEQAKPLAPALGYGRLQSYNAVKAWRNSQGLLF